MNNDNPSVVCFNTLTRNYNNDILPFLIGSYKHDRLLGLKNFFRARSCRKYGDGLGIKRSIDVFIPWLLQYEGKDVIIKNIANFPKFGYWKDLIKISNLSLLHDDIAAMYAELVINSENLITVYNFTKDQLIYIHLAWKYFPRQNSAKISPGLFNNVLSRIYPYIQKYKEEKNHPEWGNTKTMRKFVVDKSNVNNVLYLNSPDIILSSGKDMNSVLSQSVYDSIVI